MRHDKAHCWFAWSRFLKSEKTDGLRQNIRIYAAYAGLYSPVCTQRGKESNIMAKPIRRAILAAAAGLALSVGAIASMPVPHRSGGVSVEDFAEMRQQASA
ncbi:MAG: hypothetical protein Q8L92_15355, partial [Rubrivivax sp.]|nr:hypothetical protein [Rubrivivax sp.]